MTVTIWITVVLLGGIGSVVRFLVDGAVARRAKSGFPWGTLTVNITGCLALGLVSGLEVGRNFTLLAGTAAIGSYTTFSTWVFETQRLGEERQVAMAAGNLALSLTLGVAAAALGHTIGANL